MRGVWPFAASALGGNLIAHQLSSIPPAPLLGLLAVLAAFASRRLPLPATALLAFCLTAWTAGRGLEARWPAEADGRDVELVGWIDALPVRDAERTVFSFRVVEAKTVHAPRRVRLSWYDPAPELAAGQALAIEARLRSPRGLVNPGGFDYEQWLLVEGYDATGYVRGGDAGTGRRFGIAQFWLEVRAGLAREITRRVADPDAAALIRALALGDRGGFEDRHWAVLQRTGTSHLVAVSGLHIGMIAALAYGIALRLALLMPMVIARHAHTLAAVACIVPAGVYAALAGFTLPTRRALVMLLAVQCLVIARRRSALAGALSLALLLILLIDPLASLTASFWLSFGAVAVIVAASARTERAASKRSSSAAAVAGFCRLQLALTLGLMPLVIWFFGQVSVASVLVNLIAIPVFAVVVVPASLITALTASVGGDPGGVAAVTGAIAEIVWRALELTAGQRFAAFELPRPPLSVLLLALAAIAMGVTRHRLPGRRLALLGLVPMFSGHGTPPDPGFMRATILDVGHGLAVAIQTRSHRVLYDAGPLTRSGFDAGAEIVAPALSALGPENLDLMIVSHGDSDHAGGAASIVARYPGVRVVTGPDVDMIAAERCIAGQSWIFDDVRFSVLHPGGSSSLEGNDSSCVVLVEARSGALLLTGDIEARAEAVLSRAGGLAANVVVVPHHGSRTSSTAAFVQAVAPQAAIVSAGYNNRWGFPTAEVSRRWMDVGARVLVTGDLGAIDIRFGSEGIAVTALRQMRHRYWQAEPVSGAIDASAL